jgi:hypothetical protein
MTKENTNTLQDTKSQQTPLQPEKRCRYCNTVIAEAASVCYQCKQNQTWWKNHFRIDHVGLLIALAMMVLAFFQLLEVKQERKDARDAADQAKTAAQKAQEALLAAQRASKDVSGLAANARTIYEELKKTEESALYRIKDIAIRVTVSLSSNTAASWEISRNAKKIASKLDLNDKAGKNVIQFALDKTGTVLGEDKIMYFYKMYIPYEQKMFNQQIDVLSAVRHLELVFDSWQYDKGSKEMIRRIPVQEMEGFLSKMKEIQIEMDLNSVPVLNLIVKDPIIQFIERALPNGKKDKTHVIILDVAKEFSTIRTVYRHKLGLSVGKMTNQ